MMSETETATAKILGAALPGVGPSTSARLADHFGERFEQVMDSQEAVAQLMQVKKIGMKTAVKIKKAWDSSRGKFSLEHGSKLARKVGSLLQVQPGSQTRQHMYSPRML